MPLLIDDMVPSVEQLEEILKRLKMKVPSRKKRHIVSNPTLRWTLPIKYVIDSAFTGMIKTRSRIKFTDIKTDRNITLKSTLHLFKVH